MPVRLSVCAVKAPIARKLNGIEKNQHWCERSSKQKTRVTADFSSKGQKSADSKKTLKDEAISPNDWRVKDNHRPIFSPACGDETRTTFRLLTVCLELQHQQQGDDHGDGGG